MTDFVDKIGGGEYNEEAGMDECVLKLNALMVYHTAPYLKLDRDTRYGVSLKFMEEFKYFFILVTMNDGSLDTSFTFAQEFVIKADPHDLYELRELIPWDLEVAGLALGPILHRRIYTSLAIAEGLFIPEQIESGSFMAPVKPEDLSNLEYEEKTDV